MRLLATTLIISMIPFVCAASNQLSPLSQMPPAIVPAGSLANKQLSADTTAALIQSGLVQPNAKIIKVVMQHPVGRVGERTWRELWVISSEDKPTQFIVTFTEDGQNAANFEIQKAERMRAQ